MKKTKKAVLSLLPAFLAFMLLLSCDGKKHEAEKVVEKFVDTYATEPHVFSHRETEHFDSTRMLKDSVIATLQRQKKKQFPQQHRISENRKGRIAVFVAHEIHDRDGHDVAHLLYK